MGLPANPEGVRCQLRKGRPPNSRTCKQAKNGSIYAKHSYSKCTANAAHAKHCTSAAASMAPDTESGAASTAACAVARNGAVTGRQGAVSRRVSSESARRGTGRADRARSSESRDRPRQGACPASRGCGVRECLQVKDPSTVRGNYPQGSRCRCVLGGLPTGPTVSQRSRGGAGRPADCALSPCWLHPRRVRALDRCVVAIGHRRGGVQVTL